MEEVYSSSIIVPVIGVKRDFAEVTTTQSNYVRQQEDVMPPPAKRFARPQSEGALITKLEALDGTDINHRRTLDFQSPFPIPILSSNLDDLYQCDTDTDSSSTFATAVATVSTMQHHLTPGSSHNGTTACRTSAISFRDTAHGALRRSERNIPRRDVQEAIKYGDQRPSHRPNINIYEHNGQRHVIHVQPGPDPNGPRKKDLITSYGVAVQLEAKTITKAQMANHQKSIKNIRSSVSSWKSHTVVIVDKSGSMRNSDVKGSKSRLGAVWLSLAQDFVEQRLDSGLAGDEDVISIILMGTTSQILLDRWPTDYVLYNRIVELYDQSKGLKPIKKSKQPYVLPGGHGYYGPALNFAESYLDKCDNANCALCLLFLTDGRPSDTGKGANKKLVDQAGRMASKYGRRLNMSFIGMGSNKEFSLLEAMAGSVNDFGSQGFFKVPSKSCADIGRAISSIASSLTGLQTELGVLGARRVRQCRRENSKLLPLLTEVVDKADYDIYMDNDVSHMIYDVSDDDKKVFRQSSLRYKGSCGVALKRYAFGEGQERLAHQFFEVAADGKTVVGDPLVAKQSRFIEEHEPDGVCNWQARDAFVKRFCKIQHLARKAADYFNAKLDEIPSVDSETARVSFIDCSIYYLKPAEEGKDDYAVIVEERLFGKFMKWNNNNGWHRNNKDESILPTIKEEVKGRFHNDDPLMNPVTTIAMKNEESTSTILAIPDTNDSSNEGTRENPIGISEEFYFSCDDVAQAFSHFTYIHSGGKMLVCDLQGVYDSQNKILRMTDPVVHYDNHIGDKKKGTYGRTDMGRKGINDFFKSHTCSSLCDWVCKGFLSPSLNKKSQL